MGQLSHYLCKSGFVAYKGPVLNYEMKSYQKQIGIREVTIQLWSDGTHIIYHTIDGVKTFPGTEFKTKFEMKHALRYECMRTDGKFFQR